MYPFVHLGIALIQKRAEDFSLRYATLNLVNAIFKVLNLISHI